MTNSTIAKIVIVAVALGTFLITGFLQYEKDVNSKTEAAAVTVVAPVAPPTPSVQVPDDDFPGADDEIKVIGKSKNGVSAAIDVTSGKYDSVTRKATFLVIEELSPPIINPEGKQIDMMIQKVVVDCASHKLALLAVTGVYGDAIIEHQVTPGDTWVNIPQAAEDQTRVSLMTIIEKVVCPNPKLLPDQRFTSNKDSVII